MCAGPSGSGQRQRQQVGLAQDGLQLLLLLRAGRRRGLQRLGQVKNAVATQALNFTAERAGLASPR